ncbi:T3SS effector OspC family protein [Escherichia albertii]|uniref:T3SS effector OspC family protein n=1 Tax=Escherichia albertii TaxID=208962 RepID=UPI003B6416E3
MKVPDSLSGIIQNNIGIINKDIYQNNDKSSSYKNISFVELLPTFRPGETIILDNSSNIIKNFFRKTIAAQSYSKMFSQGTIFKSLNFSLNAPSGERASFQSLAHLNKVSKHYLSEIRKKVTPLSSDERYLLSIIVNSKFNFRHQSNSNLSNGSLNIKSYSKIQSESLCTNKNIDPVSLDRIINFVFQPEYHIPRMLSTENFQKIKLREMSLEEAVKASNYEEINEQVTDKKAAHKALLSAIENAKDDVAFYILSRFKYSKQDIVEMNNISNDDVEYSLSRTGASPGILEFFIVNGLIDVNKKFTKVNEGDTMHG